MATHTTALTLADADRVAIAATIAAIRDRWPVEQVILFGSKARGDDGPESGIDLLVITSKLSTLGICRLQLHPGSSNRNEKQPEFVLFSVD